MDFFSHLAWAYLLFPKGDPLTGEILFLSVLPDVLFVGAALVRRLIGCFDVNAHEVEVLQGVEGVAALRGVVGVEVARRAGYVDALPPQQDADAANEVHR